MFTNEQFKELSFEQKKEILGLKAKFHAKKAKATAEMKRIPKNGFNKFHNYAYAQESDVKDSVREILRENNLSITSDLIARTESMINTKQGQATKTDVVMEFTITDAETGFFEIYRLDGVAVDNGDKGAYKAYTNTIKYFLMNEFLIPTGDDVEADAPQIAPQQQQQHQEPRGNQNRPNGNPQPQNRSQGNQGQNNGQFPTWKKIMNAEDRLVEVSGRTKAEVRRSLENSFGQIPKYKDLDEDRAIAIHRTLAEWIGQYTNMASGQ